MKTRYEISNAKETSTYFETIDFWENLDKFSSKIKMEERGMTDAGFPLHLVIIGNLENESFDSARKNNKRVILINNGIHPGEPDGIDASMMLARDITENKIKLPDNIVLAIIPVYNIGGMLNRSANFRVDQNGPDEFGSRANGQNLDLNRDFIKSDSKNARSFAEIFHEVNPDVLVDNHVSNGADYQHVMTFLTAQYCRLGGEMGEYLNKVFEPAIYKSMQSKGYDLIPYVNVWGGETPDNGWIDSMDSPRFSSGYGTLWNTFSFVPETHMLKPYHQRVDSTYELMLSLIEFTSKNSEKIKELREETNKKNIHSKEFPISWMLDKSKYQEYLLKGYEAGHKTSEVSGLPRLYYDQSKPFEKMIPLYNYYEPETFIQKPKAYIIPQAWSEVIELLQLNQVKMNQLENDTDIEVEVYTIESYESSKHAYESHHINSNVKISKSTKNKTFRKGDWYIPMNQTANRFLIETLEPQAQDSYFAWNFFDGILSQKEGFSAYVFEDIAADFLKSNPEVRKKLEDQRKSDPEFAKDADAQLEFVFKNSPWFEPAYRQYPVYRVLEK
ncbi:M14 family metallopeptidase [Moheibacter sediminis]|uniref:Zinc carboxypeptidase n=1 Tax=Moheibacter sediminis TaxID=1434700 RepID=A0A1W1ZAJ0_9FLAO|nr:M14 family metallopeptidase [Moheibacter sediminis]SMC45362.1 Zinc carboxypeptidase [Moheibacter sediminis]